MGYLLINIKEVEELVNSYEKWYNTFDKDGYKYVIEQLNFDNKYYNDLLSSLHNFVKGGEFYPIKIKWEHINSQAVKSLRYRREVWRKLSVLPKHKRQATSESQASGRTSEATKLLKTLTYPSGEERRSN